MNIRYILPLIALAAVVAVASFEPVLRAQQAPTTDAAMNPPSFHRPFARLHLTAEQRRAGLAVLRKHRPAIKPLLDSLTKERAAFRDLSKATTVDETAIRAQAARLAGDEADLAVQRAYLAHDLRALATPEQLQTLNEMQTEAAARRAETVKRIDAWLVNS